MTGITAPTPPVAAEPRAIGGRLPAWAKLGVLFGILGVAAIALYGPIGVSSTYPRFIGALARTLDPTWARGVPYLEKMGSLVKPESMLVLGLLIGGWFASRSGTRGKVVEQVHAFEGTRSRRYLDAFLGGVLIIFGSRLAGGCTSGHIISGITQLAVSGMLFAAAVFGFGVLTAKLLQGGR